MTNTVLSLSGMGIPPYSARGLTQTLTPIGASSNLRRTVNAALVDISDSTFRKYASVIRSRGDVDPPALEGRWPGMTLTVDCIVELSQESESTEGGTEGLDRTPVPGSTRYADGFLFYRPRLVMLITNFDVSKDEWGAAVDWTLSLEEV